MMQSPCFLFLPVLLVCSALGEEMNDPVPLKIVAMGDSFMSGNGARVAGLPLYTAGPVSRSSYVHKSANHVSCLTISLLLLIS